MKKAIVLFILFIGCGVMTIPLRAQSLDKATAGYRNFVRLNSENADKASVYAALYQCYKDYLSVLNNAASATPAYQQAKTGLRNIYPYLQNGAIFNSQKGNQQNALLFAQAYMDIPLMGAFRGEVFARDDYFPTMAYFAASGTFNIRDYNKAIDYFKVYLATKDQKNRQRVYTYMAKACMNIKDYGQAKAVLEEAIALYPSDFNLLSMAINSCIDSEDNFNLQKFVSKALLLKPADNTLLNIQGKLYETTQDFQRALAIYNKMRAANPRSIEVARHVALNYYNLGVMYYNKASLEQNEGNAKSFSRQSKEYFLAAVSTLKEILASDPTSLKYMEALATAYNCLGETSEMETVNSKIASLGGRTISASSVPSLVAYSNTRSSTMAVTSSVPATSSSSGIAASISGSKVPATSGRSEETPLYSKFAKEYVESRLKNWQSKDPYETVDEYQRRVTEENRKVKIKELLKSAEADYIKTYAQNIRFNDMLLKPYDAENRVFLVESKYGELIIPVPRENNEAKIFESSWNGMQFRNPKFYINNDKLTLSSLTFVTPTGNSYRFDGNEALNYTETVVDVNFDPINSDLFAQNTGEAPSSLQKQKKKVKVGTSDVDTNIPETKSSNDKTFAVIISNEHYSMVTQVPLALNDGQTFSRYCEKTLGLPKNNIRLYSDASYGVMIRAIRDIKEIASAYSGDIQVLFYYAGHGIPNEATKDAYLLPIDADGTQTEGCYSLNRLYSELGGLNTRSVIVFLDACFSGAKRDGGMLASARGVALKAKKEAPQGNMVIFSAASDDETAFPYKEKGHGLFTYFLLKRLQESKGNVTLAELGDYIIRNVKQQSVVVNRKTQTPSVIPSNAMTDRWKNIKLIP